MLIIHLNNPIHQGPLFLDLIGTCHSELVKPAVLQAKHLDNFRTHVERGFSVYPPEQLNELRQKGRLELDDAGALMAPSVCAQGYDFLYRPISAKRYHVPSYFNVKMVPF